tara:strand:- start:5165 stop:5779 length:615 start_codon:yes stop_codon:yes gene_type:complete
MNRKILIFLTILLVLSCSSSAPLEESNKIYTLDDISSLGFKVKKDFSTEFPDSIDAKWGFHDGRDVAVARYPSVELAKSSGYISGSEQTELIEVVEKNIAYGPKVERTECRGTAQNKPDSSDVYKQRSRGIIGKENIFLINKSKFFENTETLTNRPAHEPCVRREPMYTEFIIYGNLLIMAEPLATEDKDGTIKFLEDTARSLP